MALLIRSLKPDDAAAVVEFYRNTHSQDPTVPAVSTEAWSRFIRQAVNANGAGFRVAEQDDTIVGLATSSLRETLKDTVRHFRIVVRPDRRRGRVGVSLLEAIATLDADRSQVSLQSLCPDEWTAGRAFLERWGFSLVESELNMRIEHRPRSVSTPPAEHDIERARAAANHAAEVAALHNRAYREDISFVPFTAEGMSRTLGEGAELWLLRHRGAVIGYCHLELADRVVWIESLVVDPDHQGHGLGRWLLTTVLRQLLSTERPIAELEVSDANVPALRLYSRVGFRRMKASLRLRAHRDGVAARLREDHAIP